MYDKNPNESTSDSDNDDEVEAFDEISDSFIPRDCKYLNRLDLLQFNGYTERLQTLNHFVRSYVPHMGELNKNNSNAIFSDKEIVDPNVQKALNRAIISACNQIDRICSKDFEPINVLAPEGLDDVEDSDSFDDTFPE